MFIAFLQIDIDTFYLLKDNDFKQLGVVEKDMGILQRTVDQFLRDEFKL